MRYSSADVGFILVDGFNLLGVSTTLRDGAEALMEPTHTLGDGWEEHSATGVRRAELAQDGFFDDAVGSVNEALSGQQQVSRIVCHSLEGNTIGKKFVGFAGVFGAKYNRIATRGELHKANADYTVNGQMDSDGVILHALTAETAASGNTEGASSQDNGASSPNGGAGYLQVSALALGGYTSVTFKVRHSTDDITYADLITFTAVTTSPGAQRQTVAGTVNRHLAMSWVFNGAGAGQSVTAFVGFKRA